MTHPEDTPTIERDLSAIEAALAGGRAPHDEPAARELQELALALRADAPVADPAFSQELERRVKAGFPRESRSRSQGLPNFNLADVAAVAVPLLLIAAVVVAAASGVLQGGTGGDDDSSGGGGGSVAEVRPSDGGGGGSDGGGGAGAAPESSARSAGGAGSPLATQARPRAGFAPNRRVRRVERSISMTLTAPDEEIPEVADGLNRVTARNGGFVLRSELNTDDEGLTGYFELRIPNDRLQTALRGLAGLATVKSQGESGRDITRGFVSARDRLLTAQAERRSLLRRLERAATDAEAEALQAKLELVAREINGLRGRLRGLRLRTDFATVTVDLAGGAGDSGGAAAGTFDDAVADAGDLLVGFAGVLIRVLAIALPLGLIALVTWVAGAGLRRRRRESALA